jgi:hypothetical protein
MPVKRFAGVSQAESPLPSHKKAPARNSTTSLRTALPFDLTRSGRLASVSLWPSGAKTRVALEKHCKKRQGVVIGQL